MKRWITILLFAGAVVSARDLDTLLKRERQYEMSLQATTAKLLKTNDALDSLNRRIKAEQQQLHRALEKHPKLTAIAELKGVNDAVYRGKYVVLRREILAGDEKLAELHKDILRLQEELTRRLERFPEVIALRKRLALVRAEIRQQQ